MSEREKMFFALVASAVFHVVACLVIGLWLSLEAGKFARKLPDLKTLEVTLMPAPTPAPAELTITAVPGKVVRTVLDTEGLAESETPPEDALFESDRNSRAGSALPARGTMALPTQDGREDLPFMQFKNENYSVGEGARPGPPPQASSELAMSAETDTAEPPPRPTPQAPPSPPAKTPDRTDTATATASPAPAIEPTPVPFTTPVPVPTPQDAFALGRRVPTPTPAPTSEAAPGRPVTPEPVVPAVVPLATPTPAPPQELARLETAPALRARPETPRKEQRPLQPEPGYRQQREQTKIDGGISNRENRPGADVLSTPRGKYKKQVGDAVGSRWYRYVQSLRDMVDSGEVVVKFYVDPDGGVHDIKVVSNTGNSGLANICVRSVAEAKLPPLPDELYPFLRDGRYEIEYRFYTY